jgi:hypothetical protein
MSHVAPEHSQCSGEGGILKSHADHPSMSDFAWQAFKIFCSYFDPLKYSAGLLSALMFGAF